MAGRPSRGRPLFSLHQVRQGKSAIIDLGVRVSLLAMEALLRATYVM